MSSASPPRRKQLSVTNTLAMLKKIDKTVVALEELEGLSFDEKTVSQFIIQKTKSLFLASSCTGNTRLTRVLEIAYYEAFKSARGHQAYAKAMETHGVKLEDPPVPEKPNWSAELAPGRAVDFQLRED
jgi:hypothetical protein